LDTSQSSQSDTSPFGICSISSVIPSKSTVHLVFEHLPYQAVIVSPDLTFILLQATQRLDQHHNSNHKPTLDHKHLRVVWFEDSSVVSGSSEATKIYTQRRTDSADSNPVTMCHYTISRCGQCGCYREVVPSTCKNYSKKDQATPGVCAEYQTNDGFADSNGVPAVICQSLVPFPFVCTCYDDGTLHSIVQLHQVQELLSLCSSCSPQGHVTSRAADLGGFLFHLKFDVNSMWAKPQRDCLGRYSADYCKNKKCRTAGCVNCEEMGACGHHGALREFKPYIDYRPSMFPLLMQHRSFLEEPDFVPVQIRTLYLGPAFPKPHSHLSASTALVNAISEPAQHQAPQADLTLWASPFAPTMSSAGSLSSTPPTSVESPFDGEPPNPVGQPSNSVQ
jgi:hypothetical protein